jgi:hypothetical protein
MHQFKEQLTIAQRSFSNADHLVFMTYPALKEPKLLAASLGSLQIALTAGIKAVLAYERYHKRIPNTSLETFEQTCAKRYTFPRELMETYRDIERIRQARKDSPIEFTRKGKVVICSDNYHMKVIDEKMIKGYVDVTRRFLKKVEAILNV